MHDLLTEPIINQINKKINYTASAYKNYDYDEIKELYYFYAAYYASKYNPNKCDNFKNYLIYNLNYITNNFLFYYNYFNSTNKQEFVCDNNHTLDTPFVDKIAPMDLQQLIADVPDEKIREIMELTIKGKNNVQIAKAIKMHVRTVYRKIAFCRNVLKKYNKNIKLTQLEQKIIEVYKYCKGDDNNE